MPDDSKLIDTKKKTKFAEKIGEVIPSATNL